jgi:16S rRNA (guanine527-N7)-methyltransferase
MNSSAIAALLVSYMESAPSGPATTDALLAQVSTYLDLLLRWNARTNLTAVRAPEEIITRHFGESLFAACHLFPDRSPRKGNSSETLADVGSGAGFPGLPIKLWAPQIHVTLIESHQKKATFLREVIRALKLTDIEVQPARAEHVTQTFDTISLRAVEHFDQVLPIAASLVRPGGRLALLVGEEQTAAAKTLLPTFLWETPHAIPNSQHRVLLIASATQGT